MLTSNVPSLQVKVPPSSSEANGNMPLIPMSVSQVATLQRQFEVKDYLGRKEMHVLAKKTGLTVNQVRDWFKDRRTEEEAPRIVEEKKSELKRKLEEVKEDGRCMKKAMRSLRWPTL